MIPRGTTLNRMLAEPSAGRVLEELRTADRPLGARELGDAVGLHPNTVRGHLAVLADAGFVRAKREESRRPGRPRLVYEARPGTETAAQAGEYKGLADMLAGAIAAGKDPSARAEEAGRLWGRYLVESPPPQTSLPAETALTRLVRLLADFGFEPETQPAEDHHRVLMRRCPYRDVARRHRDVVCPLHLGIMRGAFEGLGAPLQTTRLDPFVEPRLCIAEVARTSGGARRTPSSPARPRRR